MGAKRRLTGPDRAVSRCTEPPAPQSRRLRPPSHKIEVVTRYRPSEKPGSQFITPAGAARLKQELDELWRSERPRVTQAVSEAAAQGDRSENAEYTYGKRRLREIDRRVRFLRKRLDGMTVVDK